MKFRHVFFTILMLSIFCCQQRDEKQERAFRAARAKGDIVIGAVASWDSNKTLWQGIELAVDEVNAKGGVLGRKIRIIKKDDKGSVDEGRFVAQSFACNPDMVAVIGHVDSYISIPASIIYEYYGLVMFSPLSTAPELTVRDGFKLIFRNVPTDKDIARQLAKFAIDMGYQEMVVCFLENAYGRGLARAFEKQFEKTGGTIIDTISYDSLSDAGYFRKSLTTWRDNFSFDAIFLAGTVPQAAEFISEAGKLGIKVPVMGGDGLLSPDLWETGGNRAEGTIVAAFYNPDDPKPMVQQFNRAFRKKYKRLPDDDAAQGYDAVKLIAASIKKAGTTVPCKIADALRLTKNQMGVTGSHTFNERGDVINKAIIIKVVRNNKFEIWPLHDTF